MSMADYRKTGNIQETPFGYTLSVIGGKWKMLILYLLSENQPVRFNDMKRRLGTITFKTLSAQLKDLEADGMIIRKEYPQVPPKWNTVLQIRQKHLPILEQLCDWGEKKSK
ncbi:MarR family transcriptional regulator [Bacillus safensis]|uniref:MarR family transcriptional regulator n=1 Tax=Bacillus safensis TaxID=561879 RepID=A0A5S9MAK7_BACIA|nr:MarR family transcriptional regulator [Bacillus safensis]